MGRMETESALAARAKGGDPAAFDELVRRSLPRVYSFLLRYAGDETLAEDAAQDTFVKAWKNLKRFDETKPLSPWLLRIARNAANDILRKKRTTPFSHMSGTGKDNEDIPFEDTLADDAPLPAELFERKELAQALARALGELSERDRALLLLRYEDDLAFDDIAAALDAPLNTVKSWHRRALLRLRELLSRQ